MTISKNAPYFLSAATRYDVAYSLCGQAGLLLFKFTNDFQTLEAESLITIQPNSSYNFLVGYAKVSILVPEQLQQAGMIWTKPVNGEHCDLVFPIAAISIIWNWTKPTGTSKLSQLANNETYRAYSEAVKDI